MAHTVRIKRRSSTADAPTSLANAELAFNENSEILYYGKGTGGGGGGASSIIPIGGAGAYVNFTSNQSIGGTKTFTGTVVVPTPSSASHATTKTYVDTNFLSTSATSTQSGYFGDIFLYDDSTPSHYLQITNSANLTAARILSINVNDADRTVSLSGNLTVSSAATISGTNTGDQTITLTGDVTGTGTGSFAATIANDAVTYAKIQNVSATDRLLGRSTAGAGDIEEITCTAAARSILDDATVADIRTTLQLGALATLNAVTTSTITDLQVTTGKLADSAVTTAKIANTAVTFAKLPKGQPNRVLGTPNGLGTQDFQEIVLSSVAGNVIVGGLDNTDTSLTLAPSGVTASTYRSVTVNSQGIITAGTNPTTFSGYGISETSAGLLAVISDETGSGVLVFGTSPSFTTSVTTGSASFDVFNTTATTVNAFGAATTLAIGNTATAAQTVNMFTASTGTSTYNIATGGTLSGSTKTLSIGTGAAGGSTTNVTIGNRFGGTLALPSPTITAGFCTTLNLSSATTLNIDGASPTIASTSTGTLTLFNTNLTTVNAFGAATTVQIGATTGTTTVRNDLSVTKTITATEGFRVGSGAINAQTIAYSLQASDNGKIVTVNSGTAVNVTVGTAVGAAGFSCTVIQLGTGQVTFVASGTTLNSANGLKISAQHGAATLFCYATNTFNVAGNLTT
jgi:hypothetical protein